MRLVAFRVPGVGQPLVLDVTEPLKPALFTTFADAVKVALSEPDVYWQPVEGNGNPLSVNLAALVVAVIPDIFGRTPLNDL